MSYVKLQHDLFSRARHFSPDSYARRLAAHEGTRVHASKVWRGPTGLTYAYNLELPALTPEQIDAHVAGLDPCYQNSARTLLADNHAARTVHCKALYADEA